MDKTDYKDKFLSAKAAADYDSIEYGPGSVGALLWELEKDILLELAAKKAFKPDNYLDFACGTGRVISFMAARFAKASGVDVSEEMIALARKKTSKAVFVRADMLSGDNGIQGGFDLITAFRFLSNVETEIRGETLRRLGARLNAEGLLVVNTHTNPLSYKLFTLCYHGVRGFFGGRIHTRYLRPGTVKRLAEAAGLKTVNIIGYGFIPGKLLSFIPWGIALTFERFMLRFRFLRSFGVNHVFVFRRA